MYVDAKNMDAEVAYKLLTGAIVPRPIAWVTTVSMAKTVNVAPFSCFMYVSLVPPMVAISVGPRGNSLKDTANNILNSQEFVVNIPTEEQLIKVHESAAEFPPHVSEASFLDLNILPGSMVNVPRIDDCPVSLECKLQEVLKFGERNSALFVGRVMCFHIKDLLISEGKIDTELLKPLARLGGPKYAGLGKVHTMKQLNLTPKG